MKRLLFFLAITGLLFSCQPQQEASSEAPQAADDDAAPSIVGAWEITSSTDTDGVESSPYRSVIIYADGYYSVEIAWETIESWPDIADGEERSEEEIRNSYSRLTSNSGSYEIQGDSIIHEAIVAKHPNFMNDGPRWATAYSLDGDQLVTTGGRGSSTHRRLK